MLLTAFLCTFVPVLTRISIVITITFKESTLIPPSPSIFLADKSFDGSQNTLEELRLPHACNSAKEDKVEDVPPWKMTSIEMVDDEIKTQASESTMEVKEDFQEQNYCETNAAVTPNNPNTDVDSHSSNTSPTNDILKDAEV